MPAVPSGAFISMLVEDFNLERVMKFGEHRLSLPDEAFSPVSQ